MKKKALFLSRMFSPASFAGLLKRAVTLDLI
ncbi:MAG: hypothetical protein BWX44_01617 [Spirochaetes bacterium ADurb.Bin001]|nr:MAG: hypothetical protein BWX44_01617 [Spirochaetes bacterium ADurb.Bin001]